MPSAPLIEVAAVTVRRGRHLAVRDVSFTVAQPGIVVVGGPNGSGKTSLLTALVGLRPAASGRIRIAGADLADRRGRRAAQRSLGYLPQDPSMPGGFTVRELLEYGAYLADLDDREAERAVPAALDAAELAGLADRRLRRLSGGERRRAFVAAAGIADPAVLVLDEPTVGIDADHRDQLRRQLRQRAERSVVLVTSHVAEDFESLADDVLLLRGGRLAFHGDRAGFLRLGDGLGLGSADVASPGERALLAFGRSGGSPVEDVA